MLLKNIGIFIILLAMNVSLAADGPKNSYISIDGSYVCLTTAKNVHSGTYQENAEFSMYYASYSSGVSCEKMQTLGAWVGATALSIDGAALAIACTGIGLPYAVKLQVAGLGMHVLEFMIGNLPCDNSVEEEQIQRQINETVCEALRANHINCDPNSINNNSSIGPTI